MDLQSISYSCSIPRDTIRDWYHEEGKMGKGIALSDEETANLREVLNALEI